MTDTGRRYFPAYDGNGNLAGLTSASDGSTAAAYEHGPFAEPLRVTEPKAKSNPLRFSTKYTDDESGFLYYGYRYYNPTTGRWISRDPIKERGGPTLYAFVLNEGLSHTDFLGLQRRNPISGPEGPIRTACPFCMCAVVEVWHAPSATEEIAVDQAGGRSVMLGVSVHYMIRVLGDPSKCVCSFSDSGRVSEIWASTAGPRSLYRDYDPTRDSRRIDCKDGVDHPGVHFPPEAYLHHKGTPYTLSYDLTLTITCKGVWSNSVGRSITIRGDYSGTLGGK
jgi:RHS repeat-associated protein